jgi:hypothetical protein
MLVEEMTTKQKRLYVARNRRYRRKYPGRTRRFSKRWRVARKLEALSAYGGPFCRCCNEDILEFLSIDHIKGGGNKHRKKVGANIYTWLKRNKYPKGFRVLCMNCNFAKKHGKVCPHKRRK